MKKTLAIVSVLFGLGGAAVAARAYLTDAQIIG